MLEVSSLDSISVNFTGRELLSKRRSASFFTLVLLLASYSAIEFGSWEALASSDDDGDGLTYGLEFIINTQPQDWDSDNDGLPDGWEWQYGLDPLSPTSINGSVGDPDGDAYTNLNEYLYGIPSNWDDPATANVLDNGVWWNGTVPVRQWDEESAMQFIQGTGSDGVDEDPVGNICFNTFDDDKDGLVDNFDPDGDGDADCSSDDDDGDGLIDEDPDGWDTDGDGMPDGWEVANNLDPTSASNLDGTYGDPDGDGLINLYEYVNPTWGTRNGTTTPPTQYFRPGPNNMTATESPCNPVLGLGPGGCAIFTAEVDSITQTDPNNNDTDGDGLNDSYEALILLTDPTAVDTDGDGINDGVEVNGQYGDPPRASDPRNNNTDGDQFDDGEEDLNGNGVVDQNETDPTRIEDVGDFDNDGIDNWEENLTCTRWDIADTDGGGVNDGDELALGHQTDPCVSEVVIEKSIISWDAPSFTLELNSTTNLNPDPEDWRQDTFPMAYFELINGTTVGFRYGSIDGNELNDVDVPLPATAVSVLFLNHSWCWDASQPISEPHCDDDYSDSDGDGLADWEEILATWGSPTNPNLIDTDGDGVDDLTEILEQTDPSEPCSNLLDTDEDGLNNYFENTTGCELIYGLGGNGTVDTYFTLWDNADTDNGGVTDGQEYLDGTNPQNNSEDDLNPLDTDGDGIPDTIEQAIGLDWLNPDSDGGGIPDGDECGPDFWSLDCNGSSSNPWDPSDDINPNMLMFTAENSTEIDLNITQYWRWHTYDYYTGVSFGVNTTLVGGTPISTEVGFNQGIAHDSFWVGNATNDWVITYSNGAEIGPGGELIVPYNTMNWTSWSDSAAILNFSNYTRDIGVSVSSVDQVYVSSPDVFFGPEVRENTTIFLGSDYGKDLPKPYLDRQSEVPLSITQAVLSESGAFSAWEKVEAIQDFLINGNNTTTFTRNNDPVIPNFGSDTENDLTYFILNNTQEASCEQFATVFTVMLRHAGFASRKVTGFSGGDWNGKSYEVYGSDFTTWVEVQMQTNQNQGNVTLGWVPFEACPPQNLVEVVDEEWGPNTFDRDLSGGDIWLNGTLRFVNNLTLAENVSLNLYLVTDNETNLVPGSAAKSEHLVASGSTDLNGTFALLGQPLLPTVPGYSALVLQVFEKAYVGSQGISFSWRINITDDANTSFSSPPPVDEPMLGVGVNSSVTGYLKLENSPYPDISLIDNLQVILNYTTSVDGPVSQISNVGTGGYYEFNIIISESEPLGLINASISFLGWHQSDLNNASNPSYHIRPHTDNFMFNITPAPNLTVSLEGTDLNNTFLDIDSLIYLNGTVLSFGDNPEALNGTLYLQMRRASVSGPFQTLKTWYLNDSNWTTSSGQFNVTWLFSANNVPIASGPVEVKIQFDAEGLFANDQVNYLTEHGIRSNISFSYELVAQSRGSQAGVEIVLTDHTNTSLSDFLGTYNLDFNGNPVWNISNPETPRITPVWVPEPSLPAGDYSWILNFSGSTWFNPATVEDVVRIQGQSSAVVNLGYEWTPRGTSNWISGYAQDRNLGTPVIGNNSSIVAQLLVPSDLPPLPDGSPAPDTVIRLGGDFINTSNGQYNISFFMPADVSSGVYELRVILDYTLNPPNGGEYYKAPDADLINAGIQTEMIVESTPSSLIVVAGETMIINGTITDIADGSPLVNISADVVFDLGGPLQQTLQSGSTLSDGIVSFSPIIPPTTPPGFYNVSIVAPDDLQDNLNDTDAGRWIGNQSTSNLTVQVSSSIILDPLPVEVIAGSTFSISGQVLDGVDVNRTVDGPMAVEVFFLNDLSETLVTNHVTASNGSFNVTVPTDPLGDGVSSGVKTVVVSVVEGSTPFYLTGTGNDTILVRGVTTFIDKNPIINTVADRGSNVTLTARIVESSNGDLPIQGLDVSAIFHDTWLPEVNSNAQGAVNFTFFIPDTHPLGQIDTIFYFNGTNTLQGTITLISTITVRSSTVITVDNITDNPAAGDMFNISGTLTSSNGSAIIDRQGNTLAPSLIFEINSEDDTFTVMSSNVELDGSWSATIRLDLTFPRGSHNITATFTPNVNYYQSSSGLGTFDSRGYSLLTIVSPLDLDPDSRIVRGQDMNISLSLIDNSALPVESALISILIDGLIISNITTDSSGLANSSISVDSTRIAGPMEINVIFYGISGSTGLLGDESMTRVVVLAPTVIQITNIIGSSIAGESVTFQGTLLDEHGQLLIDDGINTGGVIHLSIDGVDVGAIFTSISNSSTGNWTITYDLPLNTNFGAHEVKVDFFGGFTWVDPMGQGDSLNPEYYLPSSSTTIFNVTQTSQVVLTTPPGEIDRNELLVIEGMLTDGAGRVLPNRALSVYMNEQLLTGLNVDSEGNFSLFIPVPSDMPLGPRVVKIVFEGESFVLSSNSSSVFIVYSSTQVSISQPNAVAVGDNLILRGNIRDNLPNGYLSNHSLEIFIDGVLIGITSSDEDGDWSLSWEVSEFLDVGIHTIIVKAPQQGYYRESVAESNLTIAYHSGINLQVESSIVTRGGQWNFTGRLYDADSDGLPGLDNREIIIYLDGEEIGRTSTIGNGFYEFEYNLGYIIERGQHDILVEFVGETYYLPITYNMSVYVRSDIEIEILWISETIIRSDVEHPIKIEGRILEIGGSGNVIEDMVVTLHWLSDGPENANLQWDEATGHFRIQSNAHHPMPPGPIQLIIKVESDSNRYLNGGSEEISVSIMVPVNFKFIPDSIELEKDVRIIRGTVNVTSTDSFEPVANISMSASLINSSSGQTHFRVVEMTDEDGLFTYEFKSIEGLPTLWDRDFWGELSITFYTDSLFIDPSNRTWLATQQNQNPHVSIEYEETEEQSILQSLLFGSVILIILIGMLGSVLYYQRRRSATIDELAGIFSYTAELLAAGDEFREAIYNCYESLCQILMRRGFLRRDFETVREFEIAIRTALPVSEQSLISLDRIFEEARYSSHILGEGHRQNAQIALNSILQEIDQLQDIPVRDDYVSIDDEQLTK